MASTIKTNNITGFSGGAGAAPITLSGDTATLSGTGVTFPAGHILQTTTASSDTAANGTGEITAVSHSITMSNSSHKLLVFATMQFQLTGGSANARYAGTKLVTSGSGVTAQTYIQTQGDSTGYYGIRFNHTGFSNDATFGGVYPINHLFSPNYQGEVTVTAKVLGYAASTGTVYVNLNETPQNGSSLIVLMEVVA